MIFEQQVIEVFKKEIRPLLGRIRDEKKYLDIFVELAKRGRTKKPKMRASELPETLQPAAYVIRKLINKGVIDLAKGDANIHFVVDTLSGRVYFQDRWNAIHANRERVATLIRKDTRAQSIIRDKLKVTNIKEFTSNLVIETDLPTVNKVSHTLLENGYDSSETGLTLLSWRCTANLYKIKSLWMSKIEECEKDI